MTAAAFSKLLDHFDPQDPQQATALEALVGTYPHFQTALICSAKAQLAQEKLSAESALQKAAIATYDRGLLKSFMDERSTSKQQPKQQAAVSQQIEPIDTEPQTEKPKTVSPEIPATFSFTEWINQLDSKEQAQEHNNPQSHDKWGLIDAFIEKNPSIGPIRKTATFDDPLKGNEIPQNELMTETLARVFVKQEKYEEALKAYTILSLKYPEKNSFFADQIKAIKRLQKKKDK